MYNLGLVSLFFYNVLTSAKGVYLGSFLQKVSPFMVLAICFLLVTLFFTIYNRLIPAGEIKTLPTAKTYWRQVLGLNISALAGWTGFYFALKLIEPAIVTALTSALGPMLTALYFSLWKKEREITRSEWILFGFFLVIITYLTVESYLGFSALRNVPVQNVLLGVFCAIICGVANVTNAILGKVLHNAGLKSRQVIPLRFFLLISAGVLLCPRAELTSLSDPSVLVSVFMIAIFGVAIPVLLFQVGIEKTNPFTVAAVHATIPVFVLACQLFDHRLTPSLYSIIGAVGLASLSLVYLFVSSNNQLSIKAGGK